MKNYKNVLAIAFFLLFPCVSQAAYDPEPFVDADFIKPYNKDYDLYEYCMYPGDSVSEGNIGLHLTDWSAFDKTVCGIVLRDKDGNILFGREPSVAGCESYNGPNLLQPLYSRKE